MSVTGAIILSSLPVSELRGGIPLAIGSGVNPLLAFFVCVFVNILVIFPIFLFLDYFHNKFWRFKFYRKSFKSVIRRSRVRIERHIGSRWEFFVLLLIVAIPFPGTGAYTGSLLAWFFGLDRRKSCLAIAFGVVIAGIIVSLVSVGVFSLF